MRNKSSTTERHSDAGATRDTQAAPPAERSAKRPSAHDVVSALQAEHRYAARLLDVLDDTLVTVARGRPLDREALRAGMTYMTRHLDGYHHLREDAMFARLAKRDPRLAKRIAKVEEEHRSIGSAGKRLLAALEPFSQDSRGDEGGVVAGVRDYVGAMRAHMAFEESDLFPRARQVLDEHDLAEIDRAFTRMIDPIFQATVKDAYAAYSPVVRYFAELPAIQEAVGALDRLLDSALTLGEILFTPASAAPPARTPAPAARARDARKASR